MRSSGIFFSMACIMTSALMFVLGVIGITANDPELWAILAIADCIGLCCYLWGES